MRWFGWIVIGAALLLILLSIAGIVAQQYDNSPYTFDNKALEREVNSTEVEKGIISAIAIDMASTGVISQKTIENGEDSVLVISASAKALAPEDKQQSTASYFIFNGPASLLKYDKSNSGWINETNPIYPDLSLLTRRQLSSEPLLTPLSRAGIHSLFFYPSFLNALNTKQKINFDAPIGEAVMVDSSRRMLRVINLPQALFTPKNK